MSNPILQDVLARAEAWPAELQAELGEIVRNMDLAHRGGRYRASPEEMAGIRRGLRAAQEGRFVSPEEIAAILAKYGAE